jgi:hypothetical protein
MRHRSAQDSAQVNTATKIDELLTALPFVGVQGILLGLEVGNRLCDQGQRQRVVCIGVQTSEGLDFNIDRFAPVTHALTLAGQIARQDNVPK